MAVEPAHFKNLPGPLRIGVALAAAGGLLAGIWVITNELPPAARSKAVLGVTLGIMAVGLLLVLYAQLVKWRKAHHAKPMEQQVLRSAGAGRQGISDPQQLARIDDLRKRFEDGIATFRAAGKSLYSLPWHVILGEPGSGKTEAIRHCGIGFPPGLHDRCQGVGGTINMNWWFTDHGVIIDTAGRLMFEEASSGGTQEWREFLSLMRKSRPNCPINGTLLVIPCDSLIRDNADEIERKASQIAQQFDVIQRTLDVRFPVYVVVTKSDLINGFREFFDGISDPQLQHQILGWSNPMELDEAYDSRFVDKYLDEMKTRLFRTRLTRMGELLGSESDEQEKPATDALYAFPHAFEQLGPRLKRYLDLIFTVGSQWSCKPLFFRGIYFTSSMQEGAALDEDLAAALGVSVESLPEGPVWRRDRAYFLRDLFTTKVFRESGLVTRATNARKLYARRRAAVMGCAAVSLLVLIALTIYGGFQFRRSVGALQHVLEPAVSKTDPVALVQRSRLNEYFYKGDGDLSNGTPLYAYFSDLAAQAVDWGQSKSIPWLFRPAVQLKDFGNRLHEAARKVYLMGVLQPLVEPTSERLPATIDPTWTLEDSQTRVLYSLIALRARQSFDPQSAGALLDSLMEYVQPEQAEHYAEHKTALVDPLLKLYEEKPPYRDFDGAMVARIDNAIAAGVGAFNAYWSGPGGTPPGVNPVTEVVRCLTGVSLTGGARETENFADCEERFIEKYSAVDPNVERSEEQGRQLKEDFLKLQSAKLRVDQAKIGLDRNSSLRQAWLAPMQKHSEILKKSYAELMKAFSEGVSDVNQVDPNLMTQYRTLQAGLKICMDRLSDPNRDGQLGAADEGFWADGLYDLRFRMYESDVNCIEMLRETEERVKDLDSLTEAIQTTRLSVQEGEAKLQAVLKSHAGRLRVTEGHDAAISLLRNADRTFCKRAVQWWLDNLPRDASSLERRIARDGGDPYNLTATAVVFSAWDSMNRDCQIRWMPAEMQKRLQQVSREYATYARAYIDHCLVVRGREMLKADIPDTANWKTLHEWLSKQDPTEKFKWLESCHRGLKGYLTPVERYPHGSEAPTQFNEEWASLYNNFDLMKYRDILKAWQSLSEDPQSARAVILGFKPGAFLQGYFLSVSNPLMASPDFYWYELAVASLAVLADEMDRDSVRELDAIKPCAIKFPLERLANEDLIAQDVDRIFRYSERFLSGTYGEGMLGDGAKTGDGRIDNLIERLRTVAEPPTWIRKVDVLPPVRDKYWCQVYAVETTPASLVRRVVITKGPESTMGSSNAPANESVVWNDMALNTKPVGKPLSYDCSDDAIQLTFWDNWEEGKAKLVEAAKLFKGPWAWHRMLEEHGFDADNSTYNFEHGIRYKGSLVTVKIQLRFYKDRACTGSPIRIFPPAP